MICINYKQVVNTKMGKKKRINSNVRSAVVDLNHFLILEKFSKYELETTLVKRKVVLNK